MVLLEKVTMEITAMDRIRSHAQMRTEDLCNCIITRLQDRLYLNPRGATSMFPELTSAVQQQIKFGIRFTIQDDIRS
jgi:hypothetical protein